jgi:tetratricopeptide (TPR) repeat protein
MDIADFNAALAAHNAGRLADAESAYRAIVAQVNHLPSLHNLGVIFEATGRFDDAGAVYRHAAQAAPDNPKPQLALANHYRVTRQFPQAEAAYRRALDLAPDNRDAAFDLGQVLLAMGRYAEGWPLYELRPPRRKFLENKLTFPEWKGEPLAGKRLFLWREQGFGDQIMAARFLPMLGAAKVTYMGPLAIRRLLGHMPVSFVEAKPEWNEIPPHDYWCLPLSLPHRLGMTTDNLPAAPYLSGRAVTSGGRIGVAWRGEPRNANNRFRSLPADIAARLLALPGAISLDPADTGAADFQATADIIAGLDLVISVDTATAHLAGAMGRPVWVLLAQHAIDWQWPRTPTTPWYPSARLFVQPRPGDWASLVETVVAQLA